MARLEERDYTYFSTVRAMCRQCRKVAPARIFFRDGKVWQETLCGEGCKNSPALIAGSQEWYLKNVLTERNDSAPLPFSKTPRKGCPHDCGPCSWHATQCQLPVISITNACNLRCPICFTYNRADKIYNMSVDDMRATVDWLVSSSAPLDLINITGGEPTLHPELLEILRACKRPEIGRITMNSNGLLLAKDKELCARLAELEVCVILSLDTLDREKSILLHGRDIVEDKLRAIENLSAAGVRMTLLNVLVRGCNEDELPRLLAELKNRDNVLSLTIQTMTYTGQGGGSFPERRHLPVDEAARMVCAAFGGELVFEDFLTRPASHPLCYLNSYLLKAGDKFLPFARFLSKEKLDALLKDSYLLRLDNSADFFRTLIDELYAGGELETLKSFRRLIEHLYPRGRTLSSFERQRLAEASVKTIYIHAHMDEDNFDCSRAMLCPDLVPTAPGKLIPACTYNLFYRMKDERFYVEN